MKMSVNLNKNKEKLQAAFNDVVSESTDTNWYAYFLQSVSLLLFLFRLSKCRAVFGYEGKSYDLKVVETSGESCSFFKLW